MRINIYSQEITNETAVVLKEGLNSEGAKETFAGIRWFMHSPEILHHTLDDDDRSAVTIWLPRSEKRRQQLAATLHEMGEAVAAFAIEGGIVYEAEQ